MLHKIIVVWVSLMAVLWAQNKEYYIELNANDKKFDKKLESVNIFNDIFISIDSDLKINSNTIYLSKKYQDISIKNIDTLGSLDAINNLRKSKANIAIVRGDVLAAKKHALFGFDTYEDYGIVCSSSDSFLFFVTKKKISSVDEMRNMRISSGLSSNIAQLYMDNISKNSGTKLDISYESLDLDDSIYALAHDKIDAIFIFGPKSYVKKFSKNGLIINSLPNDFFTNLSIKKGLNRDAFYVDGERIRTLSVQNFVIAPKNSLDAKLNSKVEAMVSAFECYRSIQNIDSYYGDLHPLVKEAVGSIHKRIENENAITVVYKHSEPIDNGRRYIYTISNASENDMNITFDGFRTRAFDAIPIKPRHLVEVVPSGSLLIKAKSQQMVSFSYTNPFLYTIGQKRIKAVYQNLTVPDSKVEFYLTVGGN
ncbi:MAG: hypothetical protein JXQ76_01070 [Campylobacterales bacterium]|nr:hypothetical protein [Campylobacterales bacterium]